MKKFLLPLFVLLWALPSSAAYYTMIESDHGVSYVVTSLITTNDYLRTPARGFMRMSVTQGSSLEFTIYACETKEYSASTCTSKGAISASSDKIDIKTGRPWLILDVTTAETAGSVSYLHIQRNRQNAGMGGGGGVLGSGPLADMLASNPDAGDLWQQTNDDGTGDCASSGGSTVLLCHYTGASWLPAGISGGGIASVAADTTPQLGGDLDANNKAIENVYSVGNRNFYVRTETELRDALVACNDADANGIGTNEFTGCAIYLEGGADITLTSTLDVCGTGSAATGCNGLRMFGSGGGFNNNANKYSNMGSVLRWAGASGGTMMTIGACQNCEFAHFAMIGDNTAVPGDDAAILVDFLATTGAPTKGSMHHVGLTGATDVAIRLPAAGQVDEFTFSTIMASHNAACYRQRYTQSLGITLGPNFICTVNTGTGPFIDIDQGELIFDTSYCGVVADNSTCIEFNRVGVRLTVINSQFESGGYSGVTLIDADDGAHSSVQSVEIANNQFIIDASSTSTTAFDYLGRGSVIWKNNKFQANSGTPGLAVTIDVPTGQKLQVYSASNTYNQGSEPAFRWLPTIDTEAIVDSPVVTMNGSLITPCGWWESGRNTAGTAGQQLYGCASDGLSWVQQQTGDPISVDTNPVTASGGADFQSGQGVFIDTSGGGDPLATSIGLEYGYGYGTGYAAETCTFDSTGSGSGGFVCEGPTANPTEHKFTFATVTDSGADAEKFIPLTASSLNDTGDELNRLIGNCALENDSTPIPDSCVGDGADAGAGSVTAIASGTSALGTSSISSGACATVVTTSATGALTTDSITWTPNADISGVTGYAPVSTGALMIYPYPTADNVNFKVCNPTASSITPGAVTLNWRIIR